MKVQPLDHQSAVPLHAQIELRLRDLIKRPEYQAGQLLPDEVSLARQWGVSRNTLRAGISRLTFEGLLERRAGVGTRVASQPRQSGIAAWQSFTHEMEQKGIAVQTFDVSVRIMRAGGETASRLQIEPDAIVLRLDRLRGWDDKPVVHFRSFLHPRLKLDRETKFDGPLYEVIVAESGVIAERSHEEMMAVAATFSIARQLGVRKGTPLLQRKRVAFDAGNRPIEFAVVHYRSSHFALTLDLRKERP